LNQSIGGHIEDIRENVFEKRMSCMLSQDDGALYVPVVERMSMILYRCHSRLIVSLDAQRAGAERGVNPNRTASGGRTCCERGPPELTNGLS
jgi:hypothetical protein